MEPDYTQREIKHYFEDLGSRLNKQDATLSRIETQTTMTNGRVNKIEWQIKAFWWALGVLWGLLVMSFPSMVRFINNYNRLNRDVSNLTDNYQK